MGNRDAALPESVIERMIKKWEPPTIKEAPEFVTNVMMISRYGTTQED